MLLSEACDWDEAAPDGTITLGGLDSDDYLLAESRAPNGYVPLSMTRRCRSSRVRRRP